MSDAELVVILNDETKTIDGDIRWSQDKSLSYVVDFRVKVENELGYPLWIKGSYNYELQKTGFALFSQDAGRLFAVDAGQDHHNRSCSYVGEIHLHTWTEATKDRDASPVEVNATDPLSLWRWFCASAKVIHVGALLEPPDPTKQMDLF